MSTITTPTSQPQPKSVAYGLGVLNLLGTVDRAAYRLETGEDAPTYDSTLPTKGWRDITADPRKPYTYVTYVDGGVSSGPPKEQTITIPGAQALALNLYGIHSFPKYDIALTVARTVSSQPGDQTNSPVNPDYLSTEDQATALTAEFGLNRDSVIDGSQVQGIYTTDYGTEKRRLWLINFRGTDVNVGSMLKEKYLNGVGNPGTWDLSGPEPNWISSQPTQQSMRPANPVQPMPMRRLLSNEKFNATLMGWQIDRTDLGGNATSGTSSISSTDLMTTLGRIDAGVQQLLQR